MAPGSTGSVLGLGLMSVMVILEQSTLGCDWPSPDPSVTTKSCPNLKWQGRWNRKPLVPPYSPLRESLQRVGCICIFALPACHSVPHERAEPSSASCVPRAGMGLQPSPGLQAPVPGQGPGCWTCSQIVTTALLAQHPVSRSCMHACSQNWVSDAAPYYKFLLVKEKGNVFMDY